MNPKRTERHPVLKVGFPGTGAKNCVRWSAHTTKECNREGVRKSTYEAHVASKNIIRRPENSSSDEHSMASEESWSDDDIETSRPRKRTKKSKRTVRSKRTGRRTKRRMSDSESDGQTSDE